MKRLLAMPFGLSPVAAKAEDARLGSDADPIRQMLFANQPMKDLLAHVKLDGKPGPFQSIEDASKILEQNKKIEAIATLRGILDQQDIETRMQLWTWSCLRELGVEPDGRAGGEVLGVVIEVPSGGSYDTLAAYIDGTARYLNFSGAAIFWDQKDAKIKTLCQAFVDATIPASDKAKPRKSLSLPKRGSQITLLTRSGNFAIPNPPESVEAAGAALMIELMQRAEKK
jgi:hypothetical protein